MSNSFTARVKGGKLMDMVDEPRGMAYSVLCRAGLQRLLKNSARECDLKGHGFSRVVMSAESWASAPEGKSHFVSTPKSLSGLYVSTRGKETWSDRHHVPGRPISGEARVVHESLGFR